MPSFNLKSVIDSSNLIDYGLFTVIDSSAVNTLIDLKDLEASDKLINIKKLLFIFILSVSLVFLELLILTFLYNRVEESQKFLFFLQFQQFFLNA